MQRSLAFASAESHFFIALNDEIETFLRANPTVEWVDAFMFDVNGLARGKRMPVAGLRQVYAAGVQFSACAPLLDVRGLGHGAAGLGTADSAGVPWAGRTLSV